MKNRFSAVAKLVAVVACALSLGSCNRAEYAMLPKGGSYYGVNRAATPVPAKPAVAAAQAPAAPTETATPAQTAPADPTTAAVPETVASVPAEPTAALVVTRKPTQSANAIASDAAIAAAVATMPQAQAPQKLTRVQKFAASRLMRTMSKVSGVTQFQKTLNTAKTQKVSGNLRTGIILILIGLLISLFSRVNSVFGLIGAVVAVIGLIFIVLWLLDNI